MLIQPTLDSLNRLKLYGMAAALSEQLTQSAANGLAFEERFGLLVEREVVHRENGRLRRLLPRPPPLSLAGRGAGRPARAAAERRLQRRRARGPGAAAGNQVQQNHDHCDDQQDVDQAAHRRTGYQTKHPQNQ